jgi:hypothetical protein
LQSVQFYGFVCFCTGCLKLYAQTADIQMAGLEARHLMSYIKNMKTGTSEDGITADIKAYEKMLPTLEDNVGKWVLIHREKLEGTFNTSEEAAAEAVKRFGRGPFLIRQIGAPPVVLPASVMYSPVYG